MKSSIERRNVVSLGFVVNLALAAVSPTVLAQTPPSSEQEKDKEQTLPRYEEEVLVEGILPDFPSEDSTWAKFPVPLQSIPSSVSVVPEVIIESQEARVLADAIRNVSGINVATNFGVVDFFVVRGFDSLDTGLVLTDGAFEPESTFYQLYNVQQVEVLKGPSAFLYGGYPLSGTVNLTRKQPLATKFANFDFSYGSFNTVRGMADFNISQPDGQVAFRLNALYNGSDFYRDDKTNRLAAVNPSLTVRLNEKTPLTVNFEYVDNEFKPDSGLPLVNNELPDVPRTRSYQTPLDISDQEIYRFRLDLDSEISPRFTVRNKFYFTDQAWKSDGTLLAGTFPDGFGSVQIIRSLLLLDDRQKVLGNQLEGLFSLNTGSVEHKLLTGFEARRLTDVFTLDAALLPTIDLYNPVETVSEPLFIIPGQSTAADARTNNVGLYFVDQLTFSEKLQLFVGGRLDVMDYEDQATTTLRDASEFSPMLGAVYSPVQDWSIYANFGRAFAPPSSRVVGEREPEKSRQIEVGVKKSLTSQNGFVSFAVYDLERENIGIPDANGFTQQAGNQRSRGVEIEMGVEACAGWLTNASYAFNDSELTRFSEMIFTGREPPFVVIDRSGNKAPFAPRHIFNLWTMKELPGGFLIGGGARYLSAQFIAPDNAYAIDGYVTFDAMVSYRQNNWLFKLNFKNFTGQKFETRGFGSSSVIPADPFAVYANIELSLGS